MSTATKDKGELISLPNGTQCYFVESDHSYWRHRPDGGRGRRLTGISTVCGPMDWKPESLMRWCSRLTLDGVARAFGGQEIPPDPYVLDQRLHEVNLDWESIRDEAAERGTNIHVQMLHALAMGGDIPDLDDLPEEQRGYGQAVMRWWLDREPEVLHAEQVVLDEELGFAGRLDLDCKVTRGVLAPERWIVDAKTSGFIPTKAHAQIAGYDLGAVTSGLAETPADRLVILQLCPDGSYVEVTGQATADDFKAAVTVYRAAGRIGGAAKRERDKAA